MSLADYHVPAFEPEATSAALVRTDRLRVTVLTSRLLRIEFAPDANFENRPTQMVWYRDLEVPDYTANRENGTLTVETDHLHLSYVMEEPLSADTLSIELLDSDEKYHYGAESERLGGALRTLDFVNGATNLEPGLISRDGWTVVDDTDSLVFDGEWLTDRDVSEQYQDFYFFGYGQDYQKCLQDFTAITGNPPMIPRWALGNWWSRYWDYEQSELRNLLKRFRDEGLPLSVCVIDMDWHVIENPHHEGWTGWTWNEELFPDPQGFLDWLHDAGLRTTLNLHPAEGVHPHEQQYEAFADYMDIDPESKTPIEFDAAETEFLRGYFDHLIHPLEENGVDFWWIDWQQWEESPTLPGLDPMWALNHLHALDRTRDGRRPFLLSRWAGLGSHRTPIGFSGDTVISWESLAFQPYMTAAGANAQCGWWSHDIGGHFGGTGDPEQFGELYARWTQFGVLSPINRIHTAKDRYLDKRPWVFPGTVRETLSDSLRLRHALIPYLYSMARLSHEDATPLIRPMYYHHPEVDAAYHAPQQYYLGSELLAAPHVRPREDSTNLARRTVWLPEGEWFDFRSGDRYHDGIHARYGDVSDVPLYAPAGALIPLDDDPSFGETGPPKTVRVLVFPGDDGHIDLFEDDGVSDAHRSGKFAKTPIDQSWNDEHQRVTVDIGPTEGGSEYVPDDRQIEIAVRGIVEDSAVTVDGATLSANQPAYDPDTNTLSLKLSEMTLTEQVTISIRAEDSSLMVDQPTVSERVDDLLVNFQISARAKEALKSVIQESDGEMDWLGEFAVMLTTPQLRALAETVLEAGVDYIRHADTDRLVFWNNDADTDIRYHFSGLDRSGVPYNRAGTTESGTVPEYRVIELDQYRTHDWELTVGYGQIAHVTESGEASHD